MVRFVEQRGIGITASDPDFFKHATGFGQSPANRRLFASEHRRDLRRGKVLQVSQHQHDAVVFGNLIEDFLDFLLQVECLSRVGGGGIGLSFRAVIREQQPPAATLSSSQVVQRLIDSNSEQPRPESSCGVELLQPLVSFDERFLGEVFGLLDTLHKLQDDTDQSAFVTHDQLAERLLAAMTRLIHQPRLIRRAAKVIRLEGRHVRKCHCAVHECHQPESTPVVTTVLEASSYAGRIGLESLIGGLPTKPRETRTSEKVALSLRDRKRDELGASIC